MSRTTRNISIARKRKADDDDDEYAASLSTNNSDDNDGVKGASEIRIDSYIENLQKLVKQELRILQEENTKLRQKLSHDDGGSDRSRRRSSSSSARNEIAELKEKVEELTEARRKDKKRIKTLEMQLEVEDLLPDSDDAKSLPEDDDTYQMRKLLRRATALIQVRPLCPARRGDFCCRCRMKLIKPEGVSSLICHHVVCDDCLPEISKGSDETITCSTCDEITPRNELQRVHMTEAERLDELRTVAMAFMAFDAGHQHAEDTSEEERSEMFIDDGEAGYEKSDSGSTTLAGNRASGSEYEASDNEEVPQEYLQMTPDQKRHFLRKRHVVKFGQPSKITSQPLTGTSVLSGSARRLRCTMASRPPIHSSTISVTFLGTASAQPSSTRNHSALALRLGSDVWLFDCGEATQHQIQRSGVKMGKIEKIFITHTHGDHIFGLLPLMAACLNGAGGTAEGVDDPRTQVDLDIPPLEIYGPLGTRAYIRNGLTYTHTLLGRPYVVHELRLPSDPQSGDFTELARHRSESPSGRNIPQSDGGVWQEIYKDNVLTVGAAPIMHSVPCVGYVITEAPVPGKIDPKLYIPQIKRTKTPMSVMRRLQEGEAVELSDGTMLHGPARRPGRKIVILGDTYDPSPIATIARDADLLIHEATNAHLPGIDPATKESDTYESVQERAVSRGHSTPQMAGKFGRNIGAKSLVLNHFSARYAGDDDVDEDARKIMDAIRCLAEGEYGGSVVCARDLMTVDVGLNQSNNT
ncbi:hypothetical protein VNI00_001255 [Paramarasmius palmivorus]|uniref:RING-type domain-containing protein n=1 Tax=Paramarasmius palmivorus TaxID=297713 RepID=A0AAW0E7Y3_9AGAR